MLFCETCIHSDLMMACKIALANTVHRQFKWDSKGIAQETSW